MSWKNILRKGEAGDLQEQYGMRSDEIVDYVSGDDEEDMVEAFGRSIFAIDDPNISAYEVLEEQLAWKNKEWYSGLNPNSTDEQIENKAKQVLMTDNTKHDIDTYNMGRYTGSAGKMSYAEYFKGGGELDEHGMQMLAGEVREILHKKLDPDFVNYIDRNDKIGSVTEYPYESLRVGEIFKFSSKYDFLPKNLKELYQMYKKETGKTPKVEIKIPIGVDWWN